MVVMCIGWLVIRRPEGMSSSSSSSVSPSSTGWRTKWWKGDLVDVDTVDLVRDEYEEHIYRVDDDESYKGEMKWLRRLFYWLV